MLYLLTCKILLRQQYKYKQVNSITTSISRIYMVGYLNYVCIYFVFVLLIKIRTPALDASPHYF